jgi:Fe-S cluster assembly protein SufD
MMTELQLDDRVFQSLLESCYKEANQSDPLQKIRSRAWDHFMGLGLPTRKSEVFRYIKLHRLYSSRYKMANDFLLSESEIESYLYPECKNSALIFVNGRFQPQISRLDALSKKIVILPLLQALKTYGTFLNNQWSKNLKEETDPFAALNTALHQEGAFIYIPPKVIVETPLQIVNIVKQQSDSMLMLPRLHCFAGTQSQVEIYSTQKVLEGDNYFMNMAAEFSLEENSQVQYNQISMGLPRNAWHFDAFRATLKRNSNLKTVMATDGSQTVRHDYRIALAGENAEASLNGVWMLAENNESHTHVLMDHQAPYCRSMQRYKGVLNDSSQSSFEGKIFVRQLAQKTEAFQLNHNIILSDKAVAKSKPNLEIFADDVKASHGATVGQLDNEQLFYMKTRGFEDEDAKNLLIYGFCKEIIDLIALPSLLDEITKQTRNYISQGLR